MNNAITQSNHYKIYPYRPGDPPDRRGKLPISPVLDPDLSISARQYVLRLLRRSSSPPERMAVEVIGPLACFCFLIAALATPAPLLFLVAAALSAVAAAAVHNEVTSAGLKRYSAHYVAPSALDAVCGQLLSRAQRAIDAVLVSEVYRGGLLSEAAGEAELRRHEWEVATQLRDITTLRAEHESDRLTRTHGPQTAAVLASHSHALSIAQAATTSRISELERYATQVRAADAARQDWRDALRLSQSNDKYLGLVSRTAADHHAIAQINSLTDQAAAAREVFDHSLRQAALAAEPLVFHEHD